MGQEIFDIAHAHTDAVRQPDGVADDLGRQSIAMVAQRVAGHRLVPEYGDADSEREILDDLWPDLFAAMLHCWLTDAQQRPTNRTHQMGGEGFDLQRCPVVEDLHVDAALVELD